MNSMEKLCLFCLREIKNGTSIKNLEEPVWDILNALNLNINLEIIQEPVICVDCSESLQRLLIFKEICFETENRLLPFINLQVNKKIDLPQIFLKINDAEDLGEKNVCRFCLHETPSDYSILLNTITELTEKFLLESFLAEVHINSMEGPIICKKCYNFLKDYLNFTKNCARVEEAIQKYIEIEGVNAEGKIDIRSVQPFLDRDLIKKEIDDLNVINNKLQEDNGFLKNLSFKADIKSESYMQEEDLQIDIKNESIDLKLIMNTSQSNLDFACGKVETIIKQESGGFNATDDPEQIHTDITPYRGRTFYFEAEFGENHNRNLIIHEDHSYAKQNNCEYKIRPYWFLCPDMSQCSSSSSVAATEANILNHKNHSSVGMQRYEFADYKNYKSSLKCLKTASNATLYKCGNATCSYETKCKYSLIRHKLVHKDISEVTTYKCGHEGCLYKSKYKNALIRHKLVHKKSAEAVIYKCWNEDCSYETKRKDQLMSHILIHKNSSQAKKYKCEYEDCLYETKYKCALKGHKLVHMDMFEVPTYKCKYEDCSFETRHKNNLNKHKLLHMNSSELKTYKCGDENCSYETKRKDYLSRHKLIHQRLSEVTIYKCGSRDCPYASKRKSNLVSHELIHKDLSEVTIYKCGSEGCSYETKRKSSLSSHILIHKNSSEVAIYKCKKENCPYKTKYKSDLTRHKLVHKKVPKIAA